MVATEAAIVTPKPLTFALLRLLADGSFHSGEVLAQRLGVTRASVSNALRGVEYYGLNLYSVRGRGYCLVNAPQWLDANKLKISLGSDAEKLQLQILDHAESSNTLLLQRASQGAPSGSVLAIEWQSKGQGRQGRLWYSGLGNSLTFSMLWRFDCGLSGLSGLSLVIGVAMMRALKKLGIEGATLKWPNDVMAAGGKVAGILIEAQGDMLGPSAVVIGIGLNLALPHAERQKIDQPVCDLLQLTDTLPERNVLLATILCELVRVLNEFTELGFAGLRDEWENNNLYQNQKIQLSLPDGKRVEGFVRGVNLEGALSVEQINHENNTREIRFFHAGEISIRSGNHVVV